MSEGKRFGTQMKGYNKEDVNEYIEILSEKYSWYFTCKNLGYQNVW
jgi:DivIVA domain-containing protein